ncbi:MAG TPA: DUF2955 domain-containing protein [Pseudoalteromonas sp.]|uniref:Integral membrane bound transporter domain-containing protein n=1 Tax=marine sediment metagenome TaxID=412755 RepID=A0A0F9NB52_9ZZZZ|nr:DUF2955 domain-containing protein [Pseudoalteromonas sp.]HDZ31375.1 DUF2955 domain-containing protein [Pseudoalteromonas sp.]
MTQIVSQGPQLDSNGLRQALRIAGGCTLGFTISKLMNWPNGIFFTVYPMLLLGMVPTLSRGLINQFIASAAFSALIVLIMQGLFSHLPVVMALLVFGVFCFLFHQMSSGSAFLFGALGVVSLSIQLHFSSYVGQGSSIYPLILTNGLAILLTVVIAALMHGLFPDVTARPGRVMPAKAKESIRHEVLLCSSVATLSFVVFQVLDLQDSISAQAASVLILFSLCWKAAGMAGWQRAIGTLIGCNAALLSQVFLYSHSDFLLFPIAILWILSFIFARFHILGGGIPGIGFGVLTTFGILFGNSLGPGQDLIYSAMYRFSSVSVAIILSLCAVYVMHHILNRFSVTRHHTFD